MTEKFQLFRLAGNVPVFCHVAVIIGRLHTATEVFSTKCASNIHDKYQIDRRGTGGLISMCKYFRQNQDACSAQSVAPQHFVIKF